MQTCMILGVQPFSTEEHLRAVPKSVGDKDFLLNKLFQNVQEIRTSTWSGSSPKASTWVGKVFHSKEGRWLMDISHAVYRDRKQRRLTTRPNTQRPPLQQANAVGQLSPSPPSTAGNLGAASGGGSASPVTPSGSEF